MTLPTLKTGSTAQYPATKSISYSNHVVRFLDGTDQRHRRYSAPLIKWLLPLNQLGDTELGAIEAFLIAQEGQLGSFPFTDPWTQLQYADCSVQQDVIASALAQEARGTIGVALRQNRT